MLYRVLVCVFRDVPQLTCLLQPSRAMLPEMPRLVAWTIAFSGLGLGAFCVLGALDWPGTPSPCLHEITCYCEPVRWEFTRQPMNTWSSLVCLPIAVAIAKDASQRATGGSLAGLERIGGCFALAVAFQGLAAMFFHGSLTAWGAVLEALGTFAVVATLLAANVLRSGAVTLRGAAWVLLASLCLALGYRLWVTPIMAPLVLVAVLAIVASELMARRAESPIPSRRWFWRALGCYALGGAAWGASLRMGLPLCSPIFTGSHALWHLLAAAGSGALWLHVRDRIHA
jgi:hypothetical protein